MYYIGETKMGTRKKKTYEYAIDAIKDLLIRGEIFEGEKLPNQVEFARQLGVSRLCLREALSELESIGVIEQKPKSGTIIISGDPSKWVPSVMAPLISDSEALYELIESRKIIEVAITKQAAINITEEQLEKLNQIITQMMLFHLNGDESEYSKIDMEFHLIIAQAAKNRYLLNMYMTTVVLMEKLINEINDNIPDIIKNSKKTHQKIYEALKARDQMMVAKWTKVHINRVWEYYTKYYLKK
jgi:GntR family transcriptional repressor for pyruvate dehydrogenase complex